jgi:ABC-type multidrug transport system ATPase subunit
METVINVERLRKKYGEVTAVADVTFSVRRGEIFGILGPLRRRAYGVLSGGQKQRLFLALALLGRPEIVFLDELTTGLDPVARRATWGLVDGVRDRGATVVLVRRLGRT